MVCSLERLDTLLQPEKWLRSSATKQEIRDFKVTAGVAKRLQEFMEYVLLLLGVSLLISNKRKDQTKSN